MRPRLTIFTAIIMCMRYELASMCLTYRDIHTYIQKYSSFLIVLISVGLAQARPNYASLQCSNSRDHTGASCLLILPVMDNTVDLHVHTCVYFLSLQIL